MLLMARPLIFSPATLQPLYPEPWNFEYYMGLVRGFRVPGRWVRGAGGRSTCKQKILFVRVYEQERNPATEPEERETFVMEEDTRLASLSRPVVAYGAGTPNFSSYHGTQT